MNRNEIYSLAAEFYEALAAATGDSADAEWVPVLRELPAATADMDSRWDAWTAARQVQISKSPLISDIAMLARVTGKAILKSTAASLRDRIAALRAEAAKMGS